MKQKLKKIVGPHYHKTKAAFSFLKGLYQFYHKQKLTAVEKEFSQNLSFFKANSTKKEDGILLVQMVKDYEFTVRLAAASKIISEAKNLQVNFYDVYIPKIDYRYLSADEHLYKKICDKYSQNSLLKIYKSFGKHLLFSNADIYPDQKIIQDKLCEIESQIKTCGVTYILEIKLGEVPLGDLIYDTYLRCFHQTTIKECNPSLLVVIECALNIYYSFCDLLKNKNIKCLLNTYSSYLHHGVVSRTCLYNDIEVYTTASYVYFTQKISKDFPFHQIDHTLFDSNKKLREDEFEMAKKRLTSRFSGKIDAATIYLKKSTFSDNPINPQLRELFKAKTRNIVIYAHDFYDSPHVNRKLQFPDLYQFLKQTLEALIDLKDTNVFVKIHPNGMEGCKEQTIDLITGFNKNHFHILDESVSNLNIIELNPDLVATARGTVGLEMAYFEIPTIALYDNPYVNFNFVHTCYSIESYFSILLGLEKPQIDFAKKNIYSYYFQAYLEKYAREENNPFEKLAAFKGDTYNENYLKHINSNSKAIFNSNFLKYFTQN